MIPNAFDKQDLSLPWIIDSKAENPPMTLPIKDADTLRPGWMYQKREGEHQMLAYRAHQRIKEEYGDRFHFNIDCIGSG